MILNRIIGKAHAPRYIATPAYSWSCLLNNVFTIQQNTVWDSFVSLYITIHFPGWPEIERERWRTVKKQMVGSTDPTSIWTSFECLLLPSNRGSKPQENGKKQLLFREFSEMLPNLKLRAGRPGYNTKNRNKTAFLPLQCYFLIWIKNIFAYPLHSLGFFTKLSKVSLSITEIGFSIFWAKGECWVNDKWTMVL